MKSISNFQKVSFLYTFVLNKCIPHTHIFMYSLIRQYSISKGETPYPGIQNTDVPSVVKRGTKMKKPELCDDAYV